MLVSEQHKEASLKVMRIGTRARQSQKYPEMNESGRIVIVAHKRSKQYSA